MPRNTNGGDYQGVAAGRWNKDQFISTGVLLPQFAFDDVPGDQLFLQTEAIIPVSAITVAKTFPLDFVFNYPQNVRVNNTGGGDFEYEIQGFDSYNTPIVIINSSLGGSSDEVTAAFTRITSFRLFNVAGATTLSLVVGLGIGLRHPIDPKTNTPNIFLINHVAKRGQAAVASELWEQGLGVLVQPSASPTTVTDQRGIYLQDATQATPLAGVRGTSYRISYLTSKIYSVRADG